MLKWRSSIVMAALAVAAAASPAFAQTPDEALRKEIDKLLEVSGAAQIGAQMANVVSSTILDSLRRDPAIPARAIDIAKQVLDEEFKAAFAAPDGLMAGVAAVYAKHFTIEDVRALLAFYNSDVGKKLISKQSQLIQESVAVSQQWAEREMPRIQRRLEERLQKEGIIKK